MSGIRKYQKISVGKRTLDQNAFVTPRTKHIYVDSREDVRKRGRAATLAKGNFRIHFQSAMKNVRKVSIAQLTMPTSFNNVSNRTFNILFSYTDDNDNDDVDPVHLLDTTLTIEEFQFSNNPTSIEAFGRTMLVLINQKIKDFYDRNGVDPLRQLTLEHSNEFLRYDSNLHKLVLKSKLTYLETNRSILTPPPSPFPASLTIDFSNKGATNSMQDLLGFHQDEIIFRQDANVSQGAQDFFSSYSPDFDGFNYLYLRTPNMTTNAEFMQTETDAPHKNNLLARIPLSIRNTVTTFDYTWFPAHMVSVNSLEYLQFEFYFYDGSQPNFQSENISLILVIDYLD